MLQYRQERDGAERERGEELKRRGVGRERKKRKEEKMVYEHPNTLGIGGTRMVDKSGGCK